MLKIHINLCLLVIFLHYGATVNYNPYENKQPHLLNAPNSESEGYNSQQPSDTNDYIVYQQNYAAAQSPRSLQGNSNYQQLYRYYYTSPYQQQQQHRQLLQPQQTTQSWSGPPIVVEDDIQQQHQPSSANIPPTFYQQYSTSRTMSNSELLPTLQRNVKVLSPSIYTTQPTSASTKQFNFNNNNNIVYHRDFRHQTDAIPATQQTQQQNIVSWNSQQQQQHQLLEHNKHQQRQLQHQPQQMYAINTNLRYNGIFNDLNSLRKDNVPDYTEHFKHYLENNPHRIKPVYYIR